MLREGFSLSSHERKCCFLNTRDERFACVSGVSGLDFDDDGRAVGLSDWDQDGDVDVWLVNRTAPRLRYMRNDTPRAGHSLTLQLRGTASNRDGIGARVDVYPVRGAAPRLRKMLRAGDGFLSQQSKLLHFGLGEAEDIEKVVVSWPGRTDETFTGLKPDQRYLLVEGEGAPRALPTTAGSVPLVAGEAEPLPVTQQARIVLHNLVRMPDVPYVALDREPHSLGEPRDQFLLVNLWATWCQPCLKELKEFGEQAATLRESGIDVLALNVDLLADSEAADLQPGADLLANLGYPFSAGALSPDYAGMLDAFHRAYLSLRQPLPLPSSLLVDPDGAIRAIYKGPITVEVLVDDVKRFRTTAAEQRRYLGLPLPGHWHDASVPENPRRHFLSLMREGFLDEGIAYLTSYFTAYEASPSFEILMQSPAEQARLADYSVILADYYRLKNDRVGVVAALRRAVRYQPSFGEGHRDLGNALARSGQLDAALPHLDAARKLMPDDVAVASDYGVALAMSGNLKAAIVEFEAALQMRPDFQSARANYARALNAVGRPSEAIAQYRDLLQRKPQDSAAAAGLAWLLSTHPDGQVRNGAEALATLEPFTKSSTPDDTAVLSALAATFAELGRFDEAISAAERARDSAVKAQQTGLARTCEQRLNEYRQRQPHREAPAPSSASE